ncbi:TaqI-like C-terminal specificity domain-containing protein [Mucilaginibacter sp. UC70_90]
MINGEKRRELIDIDSKSEEIIRPILRGRDIKRYGYDFADLWLINAHNGVKETGVKPINIDDYPAVKQHLDLFYSDLEKRADKGDTPYNLRNCAYMEDFNKQKLIWLCISDKAVFAVDEEGMLCNNAAYFISTEYSKYLCCVMNSRIIEWYFDKICTTTGVGTNKWEKFVVEMIPIPKITISQQKPFEELIEKLSTAKAIKSAQIGNIEKEISKLVASLYNLTDEETILLNL